MSNKPVNTTSSLWMHVPPLGFSATPPSSPLTVMSYLLHPVAPPIPPPQNASHFSLPQNETQRLSFKHYVVAPPRPDCLQSFFLLHCCLLPWWHITQVFQLWSKQSSYFSLSRFIICGPCVGGVSPVSWWSALDTPPPTRISLSSLTRTPDASAWWGYAFVYDQPSMRPSAAFSFCGIFFHLVTY